MSDDMCERGVPGGVLNLTPTSYPDHGRCGDHPLLGKIPTAEPGIESGTSWLVVRSSEHQATRLVAKQMQEASTNIINSIDDDLTARYVKKLVLSAVQYQMNSCNRCISTIRTVCKLQAFNNCHLH
jgi:Tfp pilus assembly protein PilW